MYIFPRYNRSHTALQSPSMPDVFDEAVLWVDNCTAHSVLASDTTMTPVKTQHFRARSPSQPLRTQSCAHSTFSCMIQLLMRTARVAGLYKGQAIWTASTMCCIENFAFEVCSLFTRTHTTIVTRDAAQ